MKRRINSKQPEVLNLSNGPQTDLFRRTSMENNMENTKAWFWMHRLKCFQSVDARKIKSFFIELKWVTHQREFKRVWITESVTRSVQENPRGCASSTHSKSHCMTHSFWWWVGPLRRVFSFIFSSFRAQHHIPEETWELNWSEKPEKFIFYNHQFHTYKFWKIQLALIIVTSCLVSFFLHSTS